MWAYASARCHDRHLVKAAVRQAVVLARAQAFTCSKQPSTLLWAFRASGVFIHQANELLFQELDRLQAQEGAQG